MAKSLFDFTPEGRKHNLEKAKIIQRNELEGYKLSQQERHHSDNIQLAQEQQRQKEEHERELQRRQEAHDIEMARIKANYERSLKKEAIQDEAKLEYAKAESEKDVITHKASIDLQQGIHNQHLALLDTRRSMQATVSNSLASGYNAVIAQLGVQMTQKQSHKQEIARMNEQFRIDTAKLILEQELKEKTMSHEQVIYLTTKIIEKAMKFEEVKIDRDKIRSWIKEFDDKKDE